jgi:hypothetical protein
MHLGKVLLVTTTALFLQEDAAGRVARLISTRTASAGQGELWANILTVLETRGVTACGSAMNATLQDLARTYTAAHVGDVLSHVCYDGTFFHEFPTKEVCLRLTDAVVEEFNGKQDYMAWCKEFKAVTSSSATNATSEATNATNATSATNATIARNQKKQEKTKKSDQREEAEEDEEDEEDEEVEEEDGDKGRYDTNFVRRRATYDGWTMARCGSSPTPFCDCDGDCADQPDYCSACDAALQCCGGVVGPRHRLLDKGSYDTKFVRRRATYDGWNMVRCGGSTTPFCDCDGDCTDQPDYCSACDAALRCCGGSVGPRNHTM